MIWSLGTVRALAISALGLAAACASGGGAATTTPASPATPATSAPAPLSPIADGDIEHTKFGSSLDISLAKFMRRNSGLYVQDIQTGTGAVAAQARNAVVRYTGYTPDGKSFDSGEITLTIGAGKVIRAWDEGVLGMRVGGRRRLISPPHLAYGSRGSPPVIPPNAVLVFDMELMQVY
ncbi:MAG TPA: FKBP-type peptidyl-prolyl cis-trans isomerase [Gemmatimonadaceae bacterium]|jgi:peptidylprolyl isomerase